MFCKNCGNHLPDGAQYCTTCGVPQANPYQQQTQYQQYPQYPQYQQPQYQQYADMPSEAKGLSIGALICGGLGLICFFTSIFSLLLTVTGIILGAIALKKKAVGSYRGMAIAGLVCGIIGIALDILSIVCVVWLYSLGNSLYGSGIR